MNLATKHLQIQATYSIVALMLHQFMIDMCIVNRICMYWSYLNYMLFHVHVYYTYSLLVFILY